LKGDRLIGQAGGCHQWHGLVLVALGLDLTPDRVSALHEEATVGSTGHPRKLPREPYFFNPRGEGILPFNQAVFGVL